MVLTFNDQHFYQHTTILKTTKMRAKKPDNQPDIPNIDIAGSFKNKRNSGHGSTDIHIDSLHNLSDIFGRDMHPHRHDGYYQLHILNTGAVSAKLGERFYRGTAPLFYFTPPAVPHSFRLDEAATGMVLTVRRELIHRLVSGSDDAALQKRFAQPVFIQLNAFGGELAKEADRLPRLMEHLVEEYSETWPGRKHTLPALVNLVLVCIFRLSNLPERTTPLRQTDLNIFQLFNALIDTHFRSHWPLDNYISALSVSHSRLADICNRLAAHPPKSLVHARQIEEAKWQLIYTTSAINSIADDLGFKDPAYFCRFFTKHTGLPPSDFRRRALGSSNS